MKIIKQLDAELFEVHIPKIDKSNSEPLIKCGIVHDYVAFTRPIPIPSDSRYLVHGDEYDRPGTSSCNYVTTKATIQIPIRAISDQIIPALLSHPYCKQSHTITYPKHPIIYTGANGRKMISIYVDDNATPDDIPYDLYLKLTNSNK